MANYPNLPPTLAALYATKDDPSGSEVLSKIDDATRQTRNFIYDYLSQYFDVNGLKGSAFGTNILTTGLIRGSAGSTQREILQGSITTLDLADSSVTPQKIAGQAVSQDKLANGAVGTSQLADGAVTGAKIADGAILSSDFADNAVITAKIADSAVTSSKIVDGAVTNSKVAQSGLNGSRLVTGESGKILVGGNVVDGVPNSFAPKALSGAITIDSNGVVTLVGAAGGLSFVHIAERANQNVGGGTSVALAWNQRGSAPANPWSKLTDTLGNTAQIQNEKILIKQNGTYLVIVSSPAGSTAGNVDRHRIRLSVKADANAGTIATYYGTNENTAQNLMTRSTIQIVLTFVNGVDPNFPYFSVEHWTSGGIAGGLGIASNIIGVGHEEYATVQIIKLS